MSGFREQIDGIFYINLDHRVDRKQEIEGELSRFDLKFERFSAIPHKIGGVGCGTSHLEVIKLAKQRGYRNVLIFEDDIEFIVDKATFEKNMQTLFDSGINYDVCFLAYSVNAFEPIREHDYVQRVLSSQTASAYLINAHFFDVLINNYSYSVNMFERRDEHWLYSIDQSWKQIQPHTNFICFKTRMGKQRAGMSDNTCVFTDYGV
jgi:hypothetical protein